MKVAVSLWPGSEALILARDQGLLPKDRFHLLELPWGAAVLQTLDNDVVDVATLTLDSAIRLMAAGQQLRVLMVLDQSSGADALLATEKVKELKDLKSRRVGVDVQGPGMLLLSNALESVGLTLKDVQTVPMITPEMQDKLKSGQVDAIVAAEPWLTQFKTPGLHALFDSRKLRTPILRLLVASKSATIRYQAFIPELLRAQAGMSQLVRSRKSFDGMNTLLRRERLTLDEFTRNLDLWQPMDRSQNEELLGGTNPRLNQLATETEDEMLRFGILQKRPDRSNWIDPQVYKEAWR